jgi:hypothetical protein
VSGLSVGAIGESIRVRRCAPEVGGWARGGSVIRIRGEEVAELASMRMAQLSRSQSLSPSVLASRCQWLDPLGRSGRTERLRKAEQSVLDAGGRGVVAP